MVRISTAYRAWFREGSDLVSLASVRTLTTISEQSLNKPEAEIAVEPRRFRACNRDLEGRVEQGPCRDDPCYRINVIRVKVLPLRKRREEFMWLARRFLADFATPRGGECRALAPMRSRRSLNFGASASAGRTSGERSVRAYRRTRDRRTARRDSHRAEHRARHSFKRRRAPRRSHLRQRKLPPDAITAGRSGTRRAPPSPAR